jgi:hypothetical protein
MAMQGASTSPSRDQSSAATIPSKVSVPSGSAVLGDVPSSGNGHAAGSPVKGFSGNGLLPGMVK